MEIISIYRRGTSSVPSSGSLDRSISRFLIRMGPPAYNAGAQWPIRSNYGHNYFDVFSESFGVQESGKSLKKTFDPCTRVFDKHTGPEELNSTSKSSTEFEPGNALDRDGPILHTNRYSSS